MQDTPMLPKQQSNRLQQPATHGLPARHIQRQQQLQIACQAGRNSTGKTNLRQIPGVGRKNEQLLLSAQVTDINALETAFAQRGCDQNTFLEWLVNDVGIRKQHCNSILNYLTKDTSTQGAASSIGNVTLSVEGNIGAGKTTFLNMLTDGSKLTGSQTEELQVLQEKLRVVYEPVEAWQNATGGNEPTKVNLLDLFYADMRRYAYTFQNYVFLTRMLAEQRSRPDNSDINQIRLLERSVFSDRKVFLKAAYDTGLLTDEELVIYHSIFEPFVESHPQLVPDGFVYLRACPDTCMDRTVRRARPEEQKLEKSYLDRLHENHERWLVNGSVSLTNLNDGIGSHEALTNEGQRSKLATVEEVVSRDKSLVGPVHPAIREKLRFLQTPRLEDLEQQLHNTPVLVLEHSKDIDVENDVKAREYFAEQVNAFHEYVAMLKANQELQRKYDEKRAARQAMLRGEPGFVNLNGGVILNGALGSRVPYQTGAPLAVS